MIKMINEMMQSLTVFKVGTWITVIFTILLIILLFMKTSRDERGRAIIGTASIYSTIVFIVLVNIFAKISLNIEVNYVSMSNCIQWIYNIVIMVESIVIIVLKKLDEKLRTRIKNLQNNLLTCWEDCSASEKN